MADKRILTLIVYQILFFGFIHIARPIFADYRALKIVLMVLAGVWISYQNARYLYACDKKQTNAFVRLAIVTTVLFELSKFIAFLGGVLPRYNDVPWGIGFVVSSGIVVIYLGLLLLLNRIEVVRKVYGK